MRSRNLYYALKPFLPRVVRMAVRRYFAKRTLEASRDIWPINEAAGRTPEGWPGWPEGKRFAFVLTHDVEGPEGLEKVRPLAELETRYGFRSCFNFIPEGPYSVPLGLRTWLTDNGFEVGVHDLHHNGRLYRSREHFSSSAQRINRYLKEWGAVGFRAGFMMNQLDWHHDLAIAYDASTFDTDPFEPQPEGRETIFPFFVTRDEERKAQKTDDDRSQTKDSRDQASASRTGSFLNSQSEGLLTNPESGPSASHFHSHSHLSASRRGYVELPYTLPQDSTLFLLLREKSADIWLRKLDWIAESGGMALVDVHPDYIRFPGEPASAQTYPLEHYEALLTHVREHHRSTYWASRPRDVAAYASEHRLQPPRRRKRVCMVSYSFYQCDARVKRYAEALAERGDEVDVLALRRSVDAPTTQTLARVNLFNLQSRAGKTERTRTAFLWPILRFLVSSALWIRREHARRPYDLLHIHNVPDFLVFAAWAAQRRGARVILDIHDIVPEFYGSKFAAGKKSRTVSLLLWIEKRSARFADRVIISNHLWLEKYATRTGANGKCSVFINNVDTRVFRPLPRNRRDGRIIILFPGGLQWHQGLDIALRAFQRVSREIPKAEFHIYGDGNMKPSLIALTQELGLHEKVQFHEPRPVQEIAAIMANADLGVVPKRADSFGNEAYSTKIMEFMSLGVPVIVSSTRIDRYYFDDSVVRFFESGDPEALATGMLDLLSDPVERSAMVARASRYADQNSWENRKSDYLALVDSLCGDPPGGSDTGGPTSGIRQAVAEIGQSQEPLITLMSATPVKPQTPTH